MKSLLRRLLAVLLLLAMIVPFAGCHGSRENASFSLPESFDTTKNYEITFWAKNDTNKTQTLIYEKAIADFESLYPNIKINLRLYTDYGKIYNDVITNIATGTTPNVCVTYPDHIATYLTGSNVVVPLDSLISDKAYGLGGSELLFDSPEKSEVVEKFLTECAFDGNYYALPFMRSTEVCYVNKSYVEKLGYTLPEKLTWDFIWEVSDAAAEKDSEGNYLLNGQKVMIPFIYKSTDNMMIQLLKQKNAGYSTEKGDILLFNDTTKELLYEISEHTGRGAFSTFKISSYPANFLNAGQCVFAIDSTAGATWMGTDAPLSDISEDKLVRFETEVMAIPQYDTENPHMISQGPSVCVFNKDDPQEVLASWLFTQYLLTDGVQTAYAETEGYIPVTTKAQTSAEYVDYLSREGENNSEYYYVKLRASKLLLENTAYTFVTPVFNGSASLRDAAGQLIENVVKSTRRKETVDEAYMSKLYGDVASLYRLSDIGSGSTEEEKPLPRTSIFLLASIAAAWLFIGGYSLVGLLRKRRETRGKKRL